MSVIPFCITTHRLILRPWQAEDLPHLIEMNQDPRVMEYYISTREAAESTANFERMRQHFIDHGFGFYAVTLKETGEWIGSLGLANVEPPYPFAPCVEIGWRLTYKHWGKGYATEGAQAALADGFLRLHFNEIVAFTSSLNMRSRHVMEKLGMGREPKDDFMHPQISEGHPLASHVLYRLARGNWVKLQA